MRLKTPKYKFKSICSALLTLCIVASPARGDEPRLTITAQTFIEGVDKEFLIENVKTAHALLANRFKAEYRLSDKDNVSFTYGDGNQQIGRVAVSSSIGGMAYQRRLYDIKGQPLFLKAAYLKRKIEADSDKIDTDTGLNLHDELRSSYKTTDVLLGTDIKIGSYVKLNLAAGFSRWRMKANIDDQSMVGRFRVTTYRVVNSTGFNPIYEASLAVGGDAWSVSLGLAKRELGSKAEEAIHSLSIGASYRF